MSDPPSSQAGHQARRGKEGEARLPPAAAIAVAIALYGALPQSLLLGSRFLIPALEIVLLAAVIITNPRRVTRETKLSRAASLSLTGLIVVSNLTALGLLVHHLVSDKVTGGGSLLLAALQVWVTNVIAFALIYWSLDRGGR